MSSDECFLKNKTILVTRPSGRETNLINLITNSGGDVHHYPSIEIKPLPLKPETVNKLTEADIVIFISPSSVLQSVKLQPHIESHTKIAAIGSKTKQTLLANNFDVSFSNSGHDTDSFLTNHNLQTELVTNKKIIIIRGKGGRAQLGDTLIDRGAHVFYLEMYKRDLPKIPPISIGTINQLSAITISSNDGLTNFMKLINNNPTILGIPLIVPSKIAAESAKRYNFINVIQASNATDEACMLTIEELFKP